MPADRKEETSVEDKRLETEVITPELIAYITDKIVREINPKQIIMFGSRTRGDTKDDSDIDLFIVQDSSMPNKIVRRKIGRLLRGRLFSKVLYERPTSPIPNTN
jgi:predicted nucleotidyltransferase